MAAGLRGRKRLWATERAGAAKAEEAGGADHDRKLRDRRTPRPKAGRLKRAGVGDERERARRPSREQLGGGSRHGWLWALGTCPVRLGN